MSKFNIGDTVILKRPTIFTAKGSLEKGARGVIVNQDRNVLMPEGVQFCVSWFNWDKGHNNTKTSRRDRINAPFNSAWWVGINDLELDEGVVENE